MSSNVYCAGYDFNNVPALDISRRDFVMFVDLSIRVYIQCRSSLLNVSNPIPPRLDAFIHFSYTQAAGNMPHDHAETFDVPVAHLVVEEEHLCVWDISCLVQSTEVALLRPWVYLRVDEEVQGKHCGCGARVSRLCRPVLSIMLQQGDPKQSQHLSC